MTTVSLLCVRCKEKKIVKYVQKALSIVGEKKKTRFIIIIMI